MIRRTRSEWFFGGPVSGSGRSRRRGLSQRPTRRLRVERLEERRMLAAVVVGNNLDTVNGVTTSIADLIAGPGADGISLREAILAANATAGEDTIVLASHLGNQAIVNEASLKIISTVGLLITDDVVIEGPAVGPAILQGPAGTTTLGYTGGGRILDIAADVNVSIDGLWFQGGDVAGSVNGDAYGGAIRNAGNLTIRETTFYNNYAGDPDFQVGGGAAIANTGTLTVVGSSFAGNYAVFGSGGAIYNAGTATVTNSTFVNNWTGYSGGAIFNTSDGNLNVTNCTLVDNGGLDAPFGLPIGSGGIVNAGALVLHNSVVARKTTGSDIENTGSITGSHNFIGDGSGGLAGSLTGDPLLQPPVDSILVNLPKSARGARPFTLVPLAGSPLIDAGDNSVAPFVDQRDLPRINNGTVDIGAHEIEIAPLTFEVTTLVDENDDTIDPSVGAGTSLREALSNITEKTLITFAPGLKGTLTLTLGQLELKGESYENLPQPKTDVAIVGPGAELITIDGQNQQRILLMDKAFVSISELTFAHGAASDHGGAMYASAHLRVTDCVFEENTASGSGGAIFADTSFFQVANSRFISNSALGDGGAIGTGTKTWVNILESSFVGNSAGASGGAIAIDYASGSGPALPSVTSSTFAENSAASYGGAIYSESTIGSYAQLTVSNSTISSNTAGISGGGIHATGSLTVYGSTLYANAALNVGNTLAAVAGGVSMIRDGSFNPDAPTLTNNIVAGSTSGLEVIVVNYADAIQGSRNLIEDGSGGIPNTITGDPHLGPLANNGGPTLTHALLPGSPAIDAGTGLDITPLAPPSNFTVEFIPNGGFLPAQTVLSYRVSAYNGHGETLASAPINFTTGSSPNLAVKITWDHVPEAFGYKIYGRLPGQETLIGNRLIGDGAGVRSFTDDGRAWNVGDLPQFNTTVAIDFDQRGSASARVIGNAADLGAFEMQAASLAGDYNRNGIVDTADYAVWRNSMGATDVTRYSGADGDGNGRIEQEDYAVWKSHFGDLMPIATAGGGSATVSPAEPVSVSLITSTPAPAPASATSLEASKLSVKKTAASFDWAELDAQSPERETGINQRRYGNHLAAAPSVGDQLLLLLASDRVRPQSQIGSLSAIESPDGQEFDEYSVSSLMRQLLVDCFLRRP